VFELRPPDLERDGLCGALRKRVELMGQLHRQRIDFELDDELPGDPVRDADVLRIAQEAVQNAIRHGEAGRIVVRLRRDGQALLLEVEDDGVGFDPEAPELRSRRLGLTSMEERARRIGGRLELRSAAGRGALVRLRL